MTWPRKGLQTLTKWGLNTIGWWKIYRVIKAFYIVFAFLLIYLRSIGDVIGLTLLEPAMPWWVLVAVIGLVILVLEAGQSIVLYFATLLPMFIYSWLLLYGVLQGKLPRVGLLSAMYLGFGCLGFVSGIYGVWRVRHLIARIKRLESALEQHRQMMQEVVDHGTPI